MTKQSTNIEAGITIVGAGPAGMIAALQLASKGYPCLLIGPDTDKNDLRTTALMMPAIDVLEKLGVWNKLEKQAAALSTMRIIDGTERLIRSPTVNFRSSEIGERAFGYNMPNTALNEELAQAVSTTKTISRIKQTVKEIVHLDDSVVLTLSDGVSVNTSLVVAADGRHSPLREAANIGARQWSYPQTAVIFSFSHQFSHQNISTEFHTEDGPFTQVPLPGNKSSLVWVANPKRANSLLGMGMKHLSDAVEKRMQSMLGAVKVETPAQGWPLSGIVPKNFASNRTILVGEAAHVFPPIGAQGLNLGVRDAVQLAEAVSLDADNPGGNQVIHYYNKHRKPDIWARTGSVHALNRALLSDLLPAQIVRSVGLELLRNFSPLRNFFMREGMHPGHGIKEAAQLIASPLRKITTDEKHR